MLSHTSEDFLLESSNSIVILWGESRSFQVLGNTFQSCLANVYLKKKKKEKKKTTSISL